MNLLYPRFGKSAFRQMAAIALVGSLVAGAYGVVHDQITFTISPEYFTKLKFAQFASADFGLSQRWLVAEIGFLASWWVGLLGGWFLARIAVPRQPGAEAWRRCWAGIGLTLAGALSGALMAYGVSVTSTVREVWLPAVRALDVQDGPAFTSVACIHWGSYLGGALGLVFALARLYRHQSGAISEA